MPDYPNRKSDEDALALLLMRAWEPFLDDWPNPDWFAFEHATRDALADQGGETFQAVAMMMLEGRKFDRDALAGCAAMWAKDRAAEIAEGIVATTRERIGRILETDLDPASRNLALLMILSRERIEMIAITETTAAVSGGQEYSADVLAEAGDELEAIWMTSLDERVCEVCEPLDGTGQETWGMVSISGPPAHPRCRCWLEYEPI